MALQPIGRKIPSVIHGAICPVKGASVTRRGPPVSRCAILRAGVACALCDITPRFSGGAARRRRDDFAYPLEGRPGWRPLSCSPRGSMEVREGAAVETSGYTTAKGIGVELEVRAVSEDALEEIVTALGEHRGGAFSSGMDYPGRYSRWAFGYVDPCLELVARGRRISARALNDRGLVVLPVVASCLLAAGKPVSEPTDGFVEVHIAESEDLVPEEQRSRRPTVFTAIREVIAAFRGDDPHLGLYGAFGYDLAFQ